MIDIRNCRSPNMITFYRSVHGDDTPACASLIYRMIVPFIRASSPGNHAEDADAIEGMPCFSAISRRNERYQVSIRAMHKSRSAPSPSHAGIRHSHSPDRSAKSASTQIAEKPSVNDGQASKPRMSKKPTGDSEDADCRRSDRPCDRGRSGAS